MFLGYLWYNARRLFNGQGLTGYSGYLQDFWNNLSGSSSSIPLLNSAFDLSNALQPYTDPYRNENEQNALNRQFNAQQAQIDRDWQEKMWNLSNQYNSPMAQMQRYRDAGLNPSLMMSGGALSGAAATVPSGSQAAYSGNSSAGMGINPLQAMEVASRVSLNRAQADNLNARTETEDALRDARLRALVAGADKLYADIDNVRSLIQQRLHQNALTDAERANISFEQMFKAGQLQIDWSRLQNETKMTESQIERNKADIRLALAKAEVTQREYDEMIWTYAVRFAGLEADVNLTDAQRRQADATARKLGLDADMLEPQASYNRDVASNYKGERGTFGLVLSSVKLGIDDAVRNFGGILGAFK